MNGAFAILPSRAQLQFGLRGLFLATTISAVWLGASLHRARLQQRVARSIVDHGGALFYDVGKYRDVTARRRWPSWLARMLGQDEDFFRDVVEVHLDPCADDSVLADVANLRRLEALIMWTGAPRVTDVGVARLRGLTRLNYVSLVNSRVSDESLRTLGTLPALRDLNLRGAHITDAGLTYLEGCNGLRSLCVTGGGGVRITDEGLRSLRQLRELVDLAVEDADITAQGLKHLSRLTKLQSLSLANNLRIGDEGLRLIAGLTGLESLGLSNTNVSSKGLEHLTHLRDLRQLDLSANRSITDEGIACLSQLVNLEVLNLHDTAITSLGVRQLAGLTKLECLDLSENRAITEDVLAHIAKLRALEELDLHNTRAAGQGALRSESLRALSGLPSLSLLDLSGTGAQTRAIKAAMPRTRQAGHSFVCGVIGARETERRPGMDEGVNYRHVRREVISIERDLARGRDCVARMLPRLEVERFRQSVLGRTLSRMQSLCQVASLDVGLARQSALVSAFARRLDELPQGEDGRGAYTVFSELLWAARSNVMLRRLYTAASDLEFADALRVHIQYLDDVKSRWAPTDVELEQASEAPMLLQVCLGAAGVHLGLQTGPSSDGPHDKVVEILEHTRRPAKKQRYAAYWERWKASGF